MPWLPPDFVHPMYVEPLAGHHLRPIRESDIDLDYPAVMGSQQRLWSIYGLAYGWPPDTMTYDEDRVDLARHEAEMKTNTSFNYALFNDAETALLGCVYIDAPERAGADAELSWWVVDSLVGSDLEQALDRFVPEWIAREWPFERPRFIGHDLSWAEWIQLPR
jgi:hypothetical protein